MSCFEFSRKKWSYPGCSKTFFQNFLQEIAKKFEIVKKLPWSMSDLRKQKTFLNHRWILGVGRKSVHKTEHSYTFLKCEIKYSISFPVVSVFETIWYRYYFFLPITESLLNSSFGVFKPLSRPFTVSSILQRLTKLLIISSIMFDLFNNDHLF